MQVVVARHRLHFLVLLLGSSLASSTVYSEEDSPHIETGDLPVQVDLRPVFEHWGFEPRQQGGRPTCSVFTIVGALEFAAASSQQRGERFSVEFLNWAANQKRRDPRDGGFFSDMWAGFAAYGICPEQNLPYQPEFDPSRTPDTKVLAAAKSRLALDLNLNWIKKWNVKTGLTDAEFLGVKRTLNRSWPVCGGFRWPEREQWHQDVLEMCPSEAVYDGHSVLLVGYRDDAAHSGGGVFIFRNTSRGGRDGFMPYAYARAYMNDAAWIEPANKAKSDGSRTGAAQQSDSY